MFLKLYISVILLFHLSTGQYQPNWQSLDSRPLPQWYDDAKFGIFIHWGVFSVPSFVSEWFWYYWETGNVQIKEFMAKNYPPDFTYADFASQFDAQLFDPDKWADIFNASGAQYIVLTSKHHEGFTNWPSKYSWNWNSMDVGPKRDLVGDLAKSIRNRTRIHFGLYHSLFEWFNPIYNEDSKNNFSTQRFVKTKTMPELYELIMNYKPEIVWSDGDAGPDTYWNSTEFIAWLYNESPVKETVVVNDRWGNGVGCNHGDFYTCADRYIPGSALGHKWENCMTIDKNSWGYRREAQYNDYIEIENLIAILAETVSKGGNLLMNFGPTKSGTIMPLFEERLKQMGYWLNTNGEGIYSTRAWKFQNDTITKNVWYTKSNKDPSGSTIYAIFLTWPANNVIILSRPNVNQDTKISMLGYNGDQLKWTISDSNIIIQLPYDLSMNLKWGWVLKFQGILNGF